MCFKIFNFKKIAKKVFKADVCRTSLKGLYNEGNATEITNRSGIYALYENNELMKIGKASNGIFNRMSQYWRGKDGSIQEISLNNRENIEVEYFTIDGENKEERCWFAERMLQAAAYQAGEKMPWEIKK